MVGSVSYYPDRHLWNKKESVGHAYNFVLPTLKQCSLSFEMEWSGVSSRKSTLAGRSIFTFYVTKSVHRGINDLIDAGLDCLCGCDCGVKERNIAGNVLFECMYVYGLQAAAKMSRTFFALLRIVGLQAVGLFACFVIIAIICY